MRAMANDRRPVTVQSFSHHMFTEGSLLIGLVVACEVGFWLCLLGGLVCRYVLRLPRLSSVLLWCVPLIDLVLLGVTILDLRSGTTATLAHGLAAAYVGFTVAFGPLVVAWADARFAFRYCDGPRPTPPPPSGWPAVRYELRLWARCVVAVAITDALLFLMATIAADPARTRALEAWYYLPVGTVVIWFALGPLWSVAAVAWSRVIRRA